MVMYEQNKDVKLHGFWTKSYYMTDVNACEEMSM